MGEACVAFGQVRQLHLVELAVKRAKRTTQNTAQFAAGHDGAFVITALKTLGERHAGFKFAADIADTDILGRATKSDTAIASTHRVQEARLAEFVDYEAKMVLEALQYRAISAFRTIFPGFTAQNIKLRIARFVRIVSRTGGILRGA